MSVPQCEERRFGVRCLRDASHPGDHVGVDGGHRALSWGASPAPLREAVSADERELQLLAALREVEAEARRAMAKQPPFNSAHEGWAVIREEEDELWEHVRDNTGRGLEARGEAMQTAAMAIRYMVDIARGEE